MWSSYASTRAAQVSSRETRLKPPQTRNRPAPSLSKCKRPRTPACWSPTTLCPPALSRSVQRASTALCSRSGVHGYLRTHQDQRALRGADPVPVRGLVHVAVLLCSAAAEHGPERRRREQASRGAFATLRSSSTAERRAKGLALGRGQRAAATVGSGWVTDSTCWWAASQPTSPT